MDRIKLRPASNNILHNKGVKEEMNSTPIRTRDVQNKENNNLANRNRDMMRRPSVQEAECAYPYDSLANNSKTVPKRRVSLSPRSCVNHPDAEADFKIEIENETYGYCSKCAAHLASNGFAVERIGCSSRSPKLAKETRSPQLKKRQ